MNHSGIYINKLIFSLLVVFCVTTGSLNAQNSSKITGTIKDAETGEMLYGVNVILKGTNLGAATDENGKYFILNVPVGTYEVRASMIGYNSQTFVDVMVSADRVTQLDFQISQVVLEEEEVVVVAQRNVLYKEVSSSQLVVTQDQVNNTAGIRDVNEFLEKQPGVTTNNGFIEIRGGSADQTGTYINGLGYNNAAVGNAETIVPLSAIDQVSLLSGGFNAEYGNFRSGLINVTTKSGSLDGYHGSVNIQRNLEHVKRFGPLLSDPLGPELAPFLDASVAFEGDEDIGFTGWNDLTETFNLGRDTADWATPLDYYLLGAWMHMAIPDYEGLEELGYTVSEEQKILFEEHARDEEGVDYNIDLGFGGPIPFISKPLGDATFFISHNTKGINYVVPFARELQESYVTLLTIKSKPSQSLTLNLNGMWKRQLGLSPLKPAFGDSPDAGREGGFMPTNNLRYVSDIASRDDGINYWFDPPIFPLLNQTTVMGGIDINYVLNTTTFFDFSANYLSIADDAPVGDNRNNTVLTNFGPFPVSEMPYGKLQFAPNNRLTLITGTDTISYLYPNYDAITGISKRFRGKEGDLYTNVETQQYNFKFDVVSQFGEHHYIKSGLEYNRIDINHLMWLKWNRTGPYNSYEYNYHRIPSQTRYYAQDQITYEGIIANLGVRLDYYYGGGGEWPSGDDFAYAFTSAFGGAPRNAGTAADSFYAILASGRSIIWEKWVEYDQEHPGFLQPIENHFIVSPRLGIAFPVTDNSKFYFNYGHFRSNPPYYTMYLYRYRYDKNGLYEMSNPNLAPPQTISYELGFVYDFGINIIGTLSAYYKDATGQTGDVNYININGTVDYNKWQNNNYEDIEGLEINITKND
ncbi:MAG TPA: TonB-dependent receptor, partial [Ignavibacteriaceae bacterium]